MHFTGNVWRPPYEGESALLQVTSGCTYHRCRFCALYDTPFRLSPAEEVAADVAELARRARSAKRVFLTGANPFGVGNSKLVPTLRAIRSTLPSVKSIGGFVRVSDVRRKRDADLAELAELGVSNLTIGVESGFDPALAFMDKGHTARDIMEQCARLDEAGITYSFFYLVGLAGAGKALEAARASAKVLSCTHPQIVGVLSLTIFPNSRLYDDVRAGRFSPVSETEHLVEIRELVAGLTCETWISTEHVSDTVPFSGRLPEDRGRILELLDDALGRADEGELARYRASIRTL